MGWPLSQDYNLAIQSPASNFADPELRRGEAVVNALGLPQPCSGNFADVYQVRTPDRSRWAVKCFTREAPGLRERYREISRHLRQARLPFSVDFDFLEQGIRVNGRWFPVLKMQWVEGLTLNGFVAQYVDKPAMLESLLQIWVRLARYLRAAEIAHCDLQHGNVLLVPGSSAKSLALKLVDYDGMFVPALAGHRSGEVGHPSYQHPERLREGTYSLEVDRFPLLLVATALTALKSRGRALWEEYDNGDNLLFVKADLEAPTKSHLFLELIRAADPTTAALADQVLKALRGGLASAPLLDEVLPETAVTALRPPRPAPTAAARPGLPSPVRVNPWDFDGSRPADSAGTRPPTRARSPRLAGWVIALGIVIAGLGTAAGTAYLVMQQSPNAATEPVIALGRTELAAHGARNDLPRLAPVSHDPTDTEPARPVPVPTAKERPRPARPTAKQPLKPPSGSTEKAPPKYRPAGPTISNSLEMELVMIPAPRPFHLGIKEVTQWEYAKITGTNPSYFAASGEGKEQVSGKSTDYFPVENVSWNDAAEFCKKLSDDPREKKAGRVYRLPTEAEWEFACRADRTTPYFFGADPRDVGAYAWYGENADKLPHLVGKKEANPWGLFDMYGNVAEWCAPATANGQGVVRGGDWDSPADQCRSTSRLELERIKKTNHIGFRVACDLLPKSP